MIPLGTRVFVPGYGPAVAADVGIGDQGEHHRPLDADHGAGARLGAAHRHDHHLRLSRESVGRSCWPWPRSSCASPPTATAAGAATLQPKLTKALSVAVALARPHSRSRRRRRDRRRSSSRTTRRLPVAPASNEKIPVSWAALTRLGAGYRFHTEVYGVGTRVGRRLGRRSGPQGLRRPDARRRRTSTASPATIAGRGIRTVSGRILGDESFYDRKRGAAGLEALLRRRRDASALGPRRRSRPRLAGALAAAARGAGVPRGARPPRRHGRRAAGPRRRARRRR